MAEAGRLVSPHDDVSLRLSQAFGLEPGELRRLEIVLDASDSIVEFKVTACIVETTENIEALTELVEAASPEQIEIERREA